jgi:arylsulfatase A-like enzyme
MPRESAFRSTVASLWFRLITLGIVGLAFAVALKLAQGEAQGWTFYLTTAEVVFEVVVRLLFASLAGIVLGTLCTAAIAPFLWHFKSSRERITEWATKGAVVLVVFLDSRFAFKILIKTWAPNRGPRFTTALLAAHFLTFVVVLCLPRARRQVVTSIDGFLGKKMTRRTAIATVVGTVGLVATEFALSKAAPVVKAALAPQRPKSNLLMITFDALSAEDMSLYGYWLPTTPNIDAFASKATVFENFYSASSFTGSSLATILTGVYPAQHGVYHLMGRVRPEYSNKTLAHLMRNAGYTTGAFVSNWAAYYIVENLKSGYDFLPAPTFQEGGLQSLWEATGPLHQHTGIGNRADEYHDLMAVWNSAAGLPDDLNLRFPAAESFAQARKILAQMPDGFFLWVHVMSPHAPYHPGAAERGRFISDDQLRTFEDEENDSTRVAIPPVYGPELQYQVDQRRLAYDECLATADSAFGGFMSELESSGKLRNTTVIVSADHGESFRGGIYQHGGRYLTRPVLHIPLIIRTPNQQEGRTVAFVADQTAIVPTVLELAGQPKPDWMPGQSLARWLKGDSAGEGQGLAFCQYLEINRIFKPPRHGSAGVIDGQYQYVVVLSTQNGGLRPLKEAETWNMDYTAEYPARAKALRETLSSRFPDLVRRAT